MRRAPRTSRLHPSALLHTGTVGLRTRRLRALLPGLGIAIDIASMVGVLGISGDGSAPFTEMPPVSSLERGSEPGWPRRPDLRIRQPLDREFRQSLCSIHSPMEPGEVSPQLPVYVARGGPLGHR